MLPSRAHLRVNLSLLRSITLDRSAVVALFAIFTIAGLLCGGIYLKARADEYTALAHYRLASLEESRKAAEVIDGKLRQIQQGLRTISLLPSVRRISRYGENLDDDAYQSIQQLYNNLAANVAISEVYIVPVDLKPDRIDPHTREMQAPILMFDQMIVNAAARARGSGEIAEGKKEAEDDADREIEIFEYRQLSDQMAYLLKRYPNDRSFTGIERPMLSSEEVITCDNTSFIHTHRDSDRTGIVLSVPFYDFGGRLKGTVSAIIRTAALSAYLPERNYALINTAHEFRAPSRLSGVETLYAHDVNLARPAADLIYSAVVPLDVSDARGRWLVWAGRPNADYLTSSSFREARSSERWSYSVIALLGVLAAASILVAQVQARLQRANRDQLRELVRVRTAQVDEMARAQTAIAASEARARHLAYHDALTGLPNRARLWDRLAEALEAARRDGAAFSVHCIDLDQFKAVNDTFGHQAGDELIRKAAKVLASTCRKVDTLARLGGDEFAIVQMHATPAATAALADRVVQLMAAPFDLSVGQVHIGCSVGVTIISDPSIEPLETLRQADLALYRAKENGRGRFSFFEPEMDAAVRTRRALQADLRIALANDELEIAYQPQVNEGGEIKGLEALARWNHRERGGVSPSLFIPIAEESGLIVDLGFFTLRRAFLDSTLWPHLRVAINISAHQIRMKDFVTKLVQLVRETRVNPANFELEITEGVLLGDDPATHATLRSLRELGFGLALDDFGTGYSSLSYLQRYPIDKIKIDRSFITNLGIDTEAEAVVSAIVKLARALNLHVIAEGVETITQRDLLASAGCTEIQGYLYGKPMPASAMRKLIQKRRPLGAVAIAAG